MMLRSWVLCAWACTAAALSSTQVEHATQDGSASREVNEACLLAGRLHEAVVEIDRRLGDVDIDARRALVQPGWADPIISALRPCLEAPHRASDRKPPVLSIGVYGGSMTAGFMNCHSQARIYSSRCLNLCNCVTPAPCQADPLFAFVRRHHVLRQAQPAAPCVAGSAAEGVAAAFAVMPCVGSQPSNASEPGHVSLVWIQPAQAHIH